MAVIAIDLGATKLLSGVFSETGELLHKEKTALNNSKGAAVGALIAEKINALQSIWDPKNDPVHTVGVAVPGISRSAKGTVWAPNIPGWEDYPLLQQLQQSCKGAQVTIDNDRACSLLGEVWKGNARQCNDVIFLAVGTGIGAGIMVNGNIVRGAQDIAGAIGWMALDKPFRDDYLSCGCFEYHASGEGIAKVAREFLQHENDKSLLNIIPAADIKAHHVFDAYSNNDPVAIKIIKHCIKFWGMAAANLVSLFNPEKIIFGGGVFGPALRFLPEIINEARRWAQPVSMSLTQFEPTALGDDACLYGAAYSAFQKKMKP